MDVYLYCNISQKIYQKSIQKYIWKNEKVQIDTISFKYILFSNVLVIKRFDYSDIGSYVCTAINNGKKTYSVNITLKLASK